MKNFALPLLVAIMVVGLSLAITEKAEATQLRAATVNVPCVSEVVSVGHGKYVITVETASKTDKLKLVYKGKRVRIDKVGKRVWMAYIKKGKLYKISNGAHSIKYMIRR